MKHPELYFEVVPCSEPYVWECKVCGVRGGKVEILSRHNEEKCFKDFLEGRSMHELALVSTPEEKKRALEALGTCWFSEYHTPGASRVLQSTVPYNLNPEIVRLCAGCGKGIWREHV